MDYPLRTLPSPWLPLCLLVVVVYGLLLAPRKYRASTVLEISVDPASSQPLPSTLASPATIAWHSFVPEHLNAPLIILICLVLTFLIGYVLLLIGVFLIVRRDAATPEAG